MRPLLVALGAVMVLVGAVWTLQGLGYLEGDEEGPHQVSSRLRILPVAVIGRASTNWTMRGYL